MKGIVIKTKLGFASAITLFPFILTETMDETVLNHERIHLKQQLEMLIIPFYLWYILEYLIRWIGGEDRYEAYSSISMERECFENDSDMTYISNRKPYSFIKYL